MTSTNTSIDTSGIANTIYHGAVISGLSVGYSMIGYKLLKITSPSLYKLGIEDIAKLTAIVSGALGTQTWLVSQGILPPNIVN